MTCSDCEQTARYEIRGIRKCSDHYIEALEHSAHLTSFAAGVQDVHIRFVEPSPESLKNHLDNHPNYRYS